MELTTPKSDVGVIVGRFQVHELHEAHLALIKHVIDNSERTLIFLGLSPCRVTQNNPLDFSARKQMVQAAFPDVDIFYIEDCVSDELWSSRLDTMIEKQIRPGASVRLYGGRDAFIKHYFGKFPTTEMKQQSYISGTDLRKTISNRTKGSPDFRAGVIWASQNQWPKAIPTVDIAIWNEEKTELLLARKPDETLYRFIGGFAQGPTYESDARREVAEEAGIDITDPQYVGSHQIDDWRYRSEKDKIVTLLFEAKKFSGKPEPDDDISELKWFQFANLRESVLVPEHRPLLKMLRCKMKGASNEDAAEHLSAD